MIIADDVPVTIIVVVVVLVVLVLLAVVLGVWYYRHRPRPDDLVVIPIDENVCQCTDDDCTLLMRIEYMFMNLFKNPSKVYTLYYSIHSTFSRQLY